MQENFGEVFTRRWVAETLLDLVGYNASESLVDKTILEPSVGSGAFLVPLLERLLASLRGDKERLLTAFDAIRAYDLQSSNVEACRKATTSTLVQFGLERVAAENLAKTWIQTGDFLLVEEIPQADFVVGNPPYIRIEDLPTELSNDYRSKWITMKGRADIFVGFFERSLDLLKPESRMGFICADRWMRNQYGSALRQLISEKYAVEDIWLMHDVDAFEAEVSAYPAITVLSTRDQGHVIVADANESFDRSSAVALMKWARTDHTTAEGFESMAVSAHKLSSWFKGAGPWPNGNAAELALISTLEDSFPPLESPLTGTKVSIGVATGADKAYIVKAADIEPSRLLPLSMVGDLRADGEFVWGGNFLVNPWNDQGQLIDLAQYPKIRRYLEQNELIKRRYVAQKTPAAWYRTIDKVTHSITNQPKLLIQDMRTEINPVLEPGGYYPHHNLYYVTSRDWDLEVLGGLLLSAHAQILIGAYAVRMRGGTIRFQSQYLRLIRVPEIRDVNSAVADDLRRAFRERDKRLATSAAEKAYNIRLSDYGLVGEAEVAT